MNQHTCILCLASLLVIGVIVAGCTGIPGVDPGQPGPATDAETSVVGGNNRFAFDIYAELAHDSGGNIFFSPLSISEALAITCDGASGVTAEEIRSVFHFPENDTARREGFFAINAGINGENAGYTLRIANALWAEETYPFLPAFIDTAQRYYSAEVTNLDFINTPEDSRIIINDWVEDETENKIKDLLPSGSIDPVTRLVITNAIYFKGTWVKQFEETATHEADFRTGAADETVRVRMMQRTDEDAVYGYTETGTLQVLEMPYAHESGRELSMLVVLPKNDDLSAVEASLDVEGLSELRQSLQQQRVEVYFPKFTLDTEYQLPETLSAMGMPTAFGPGADFRGMDGTKNLFISDAVHKAYIDVNEEGTEAAAATGVVVGIGAAPPEDDVPVFRADHPFIFAIQDSDTGNILFMGRVVRPSSA